MKQKLITIYMIFTILWIGSAINIKSNDVEYKEGNKVLSQEQANQMIKDNNGILVQLEDDEAPEGYPFFVGYNSATHKAVYTNKLDFTINPFSVKITTIKNVGTWRYGGYWGVMMVDQNNNLVYCGDYGKNEPIGNSNWKSQESDKIKKALSWGYPNVESSTSKNDNYARTQLAIWTAQKAIKANSTTLGVYQKVADAYLNKIGVNEKTFSKSLSDSTKIINNINMSKMINVSGSAKYKFNKDTFNKLTSQKTTPYVYQNASKKYLKAIVDKWYAPSQYKNFRIGTSDLNKQVNISNIKIITDLKPISGYIYDNGKSGDQRIFMSVKEPVKNYEVNLSIEQQTGKISATKQLNKYGEYTYVKGVQFGVYQSEVDAKNDKNRLGVMITNDEGKAISNYLVPKTYYVKEIKGITNYKVSDVIGKVIVKKAQTTRVDGTPNNDAVASFRNTFELGKIVGYKVFDDTDLYEQIIKDDTGNSIILTDDGKPVIFEDDDYSLSVARYPSKQTMIADDLFNKPIVLKIPEYNYIYEKVIKLDENNQPIPILDEHNKPIINEFGEQTYEEEFVVKRDSENRPYVKAKRDNQGNILYKDKVLDVKYPMQKDMDNIIRINDIEFSLYDSNRRFIKKVLSKTIENQKGAIVFEDLKPGVYYIKESKTLDNLVLSKNEYQVEVKANQQNMINKGRDIINIPQVGQLEITKTNVLKERLKGVTFAVYDIKVDGSIDKNKLIDVITTDDKGKAYFNYYAGEYYIKEISSHPKHIINEKEVKFLLKNEEATKLTFKNNIFTKDIEISKIDFFDGKYLSGAKLCLNTKNDDYFYLKTKKNKVNKVREYCWISQSKKHELELEPQIYYIKELVAPKGYEKNNEFIKLDTNKTTHLKITNKLIEGMIEVSKVDATNENELVGAKMCLMKKDKRMFRINIDNKESNVKKYCWISTAQPKKMNLYYGDYIIEEIIAPKGYLRIKTLIPLSIKKEGIQKVRVKNEAIKLDLVQSGQDFKLVILCFLVSLVVFVSYLLLGRKVINK